jgi:TolB-like protein
MSFLGEIKRRKVFQVGAVYVVVAWLIMQIVDVVNEPLNLPDWFDTVAILLLGIGFPIALILSWAFELTPDGLTRDDGGASPSRGGRRLEYVLVGLLVVAVGWIGYRELGSSVGEPGGSAGETSVAVLPFTNLSADPGQEFFSDGMTEEITSALAKVRGLGVVGRTSAFQFKNQARDLREIGSVLGASHLVEGSIRKSGVRLRITAQLIRVDSGVEIWTNTYDREMTDVFAIQEEIARQIAGSLRAPLGLQEGDQLVANRAIDAEDYQEYYLRAKNLFHARGGERIAEAAKLLEDLVDRNPDYAPAWGLLAQAYDFIPNYDPAWFSGDFERLRPVVSEMGPKAEIAARRAIELDPNLAAGYYSLALALEQRGELIEAEDLFQRAYELDPNDPDVLHLYSRMLAKVGRLEDAHSMRERLTYLDPLVQVYRAIAAFVLWLLDRDDEAIAMAENLEPLHRSYVLSRMLAADGRYAYAADVVESDSRELNIPETTEAVARLLRAAPTDLRSPESLPHLGLFAFVYLHVGAPERALEPHEDGVEIGYSASAFNALLWHSSYADLRKTERFKKFLLDAGVVEYWRERGWPSHCQPLGGADFECR